MALIAFFSRWVEKITAGLKIFDNPFSILMRYQLNLWPVDAEMHMKCTTLAETSCDFLQLFSYASIFLELQWMTPNEVDPMLSISATVKSSIFGRNDGGMLYHIYINRSPNHIILYSTNLHQPKGLITISYQSLARFIWVPRTLQKEVVSLLLIQRCHLVVQLLKGRLC